MNCTKFFFFIFISFFLIQNVNATNNISFINLDLILNESVLGQKVLLNLKNLNETNNKTLKKIENEIINNENEIKKIQNVISKEDLNLKIQKLKKKIEEFNSKRSNFDKDFEKKRDEDILNFFKKINPLVQNYMDNNQINMVIEKKYVFIGRSIDDITQDILKLINEEFK